ncbi:helix-turn-helix domain-containing protein [Streptomyces sp. NPDC057623]|uniref:helix-turn-helix domain-containing protein n=1 Tax=Streptomyces sp. NPDC057623 TaxID=3346187 RepID=UPI003695B144
MSVAFTSQRPGASGSPWPVRYGQGGGLTDVGRATRERFRLQAVERFEGGEKNREIAAALRVSERSVERWRRAWRERGEAGVLSKGSPGRPRLSEAQVARLERELEAVVVPILRGVDRTGVSMG